LRFFMLFLRLLLEPLRLAPQGHAPGPQFLFFEAERFQPALVGPGRGFQKLPSGGQLRLSLRAQEAYILPERFLLGRKLGLAALALRPGGVQGGLGLA
jgi:hypothetical protein